MAKHHCILFSSLILLCATNHTFSFNLVRPSIPSTSNQPSMPRYTPDSQIRKRGWNPKGVEVSNGYFSFSWPFSFDITAALNYVSKRLPLGGTMTRFVIVFGVALIFVFGGALLMWIGCWKTCTFQYTVLKSYLMLFRYALPLLPQPPPRRNGAAGSPAATP
jgi:hypothetical protein